MKLILTQDVPNLGSLGDTVEVKSGYGRNYLIPQGMALSAGNRASKELQHRLHYLEKMRAGKIAIAREQAEKIQALSLEVVRKAGPGGRLFGSVTNRDLLNLLNEQGFEFERRAVTLLTPIRNVGNHEFSVKVHSEVKIELQVKVMGELDAALEKETGAEATAGAASEESLENGSETDEETESRNAENDE